MFSTEADNPLLTRGAEIPSLSRPLPLPGTSSRRAFLVAGLGILVLLVLLVPKLVPFFRLFSGQDGLEFDSAGRLAFFAFR